MTLALPPADERTVDGRRTRCRISGDGPPVVLLHGIGRTLDDFTALHTALARDHLVLAVDLPGHGGSAPLDGPHTLPALAAAVARFLDAAEVTGPAHLVGNSLGGAVAMRLAVDTPRRVASLALLNSAGFGREVTVALRLLAVRPLARLLLRPHPRIARRTERAIFYDPAYVTDERIATALAAAGQPHAARVMLELVRDLGTWRGVRPQWRADLLDAVAALDLPTLLVWGERDLVLPAAHLAYARTRLPNARSHLFRDTGHMPQIERTAEVEALLRELWA
ncbi:alpha/beta fold hydrolase [Micromonospora aurantiaca]|uniref:Alpha/beta fold hydrolase n=1 Tax=Micromonospora aurantiaca (nom. illeg.) TaxID=47850 RepID=A0ABQ6UDU2_9ACTN|nr:alpha/beta fold hydrolase [Micromonospora aurantiaca]KAB1109601.1 alpha/beta fold hydrolase [Micromonospora aurantiaca]UFN91598.1 alpha/beta fold hydrolase [Micromonospora aurantiaca]